MKPIAINVSAKTYKVLQHYAREVGRTASELIRQAREEFVQRRIVNRPSLLELQPLRLGRVLKPLEHRGELAPEMLDE